MRSARDINRRCSFLFTRRRGGRGEEDQQWVCPRLFHISDSAFSASPREQKRTAPNNVAPPSRRSQSAFRIARILLPVPLLLAACGNRPDPPSAGPLAAATTLVERPRAPSEEDGIEIVRWSVANRESVIRRALLRHAEHPAPMRIDAGAFEQAGFRAGVLRDEHLASFLADLGGTTTAVATWFGQVPQWREAALASITAAQPTMIEGRAEQFSTGLLRLMIRGWTVELEEGACFELQLVPQWAQEAADLSLLGNRDAPRGRLFPGAALRVELQRGTSLVLVSSPPLLEEEEDPEGPPAATRAAGSRGPHAALPPTLGELLLTDSAARPPRRIVLIFRPRLPDTLFPADPS